MKYKINLIKQGEDELILNYQKETPEVNLIFAFMEKRQQKLPCKTDDGIVMLSPDQILYAEKVDEKTFAYTTDQVLQLDLSLMNLELFLDDIKFFRCSKSMIVNIEMVERLKSLPSNRIDTIMYGGEHIIISRTYASEFRKRLRGEA
jgi:DNA-binding LytR/AlgR family response regulator